MSTAEIKKAMMEKIREAKIAAKTRAGVAKAPEADILELGSVAAHTAAKKHSLTRKIQRKINPRMIDDYIIVKQSKTERIDDIHKFERAVKRKLADGYILQGGICIHKDGYYQALTKRKLESNSKSTNNGAGVDLLNDVSPELLKLGED